MRDKKLKRYLLLFLFQAFKSNMHEQIIHAFVNEKKVLKLKKNPCTIKIFPYIMKMNI